MKRQKSFKNDRPSLYLVATPIGNLSEFNFRAIDILKTVDVIACEDTRTSKTLLKHYDINKNLISYHNFNEKQSSKGIISLLKDGKNVALISDAGYPLVSDPGYELVNEVIDNDFNVVTISGASAFLNALVASGLDTRHYLFYGFLSSKDSEQIKQLQALENLPYTMIFYESPHRINKTLNNMFNVFNDRKVCLARELTKQYEEYIRGTLSEIKDLEDLKGEMVIVVQGYTHKQETISLDNLLKTVESYLETGLSAKDAIDKVAKENQVPKKLIYNHFHKKDLN